MITMFVIDLFGIVMCNQVYFPLPIHCHRFKHLKNVLLSLISFESQTFKSTRKEERMCKEIFNLIMNKQSVDRKINDRA